MSEVLISIDGLSKKYPLAEGYSIDSVSFNVNLGDRFGIFGPNGAGKTTLISILCGILPYKIGNVKYYVNNNIVSFKEIKKSIGLVPQDLALYDELTAFQNIEYFGALNNMSCQEIRDCSIELFDVLGLNNVLSKKVKTFSGGMKRRLNLAIGVINKPRILFLDEPTVGVDVQSKNAILSFLNRINEEGTTIIYTSHLLEEAEKLCSRIAILDYGNLIAIDRTKDLLEKYKAENLNQLLLELTGKEFRDNV